MAFVYPGSAAIPDYESSLAKFMPAFEKGQTERKDSDAFDAAAKAFGGKSSAPAAPQQNFLERLLGIGQQGPFTRPQPGQTATAAIEAAAPQTPAQRAIAAETRPVNGMISDMSNVPGNYMANARAAESGGNDTAANPNSSALGRYQFLDSTWQGLAQKYPELGLTPDGRTDPAQQERAMAAFTRDNAGALSSAGIPVNPGTLYAAHFLGAGGATKALSADPSTPMSAVVDPGVIQANPQLQNQTVGEFAQWAAQKGGNSGGGYQPPMRDEGAGQGQPFTPDEGTMRAMLASEATRPLAMKLIEAQQQSQASQGRFVTEQGQDGGIWQRDTLTGERSVLSGPQKPEQRRIVQGPDGNQYYEDGARVLPGVDAAPEPGFRTLAPDEITQMGLPPGSYQMGPDNKVYEIGGSGTNVTVNTGDGQDGALDKALSTEEGKAWAGYKSAATVSASNAQDFDILGELLTLSPQGPITGRLAETFKGFSAAGDAAQSIIKRIAPTLRAPGSGATSDIEYDGMLRSLPSLSQMPEANKMVLALMQAKAQINMERGRLITAYQSQEVNPSTGKPWTAGETRRRMDELDSQSIMTPEMKKALLGLGGDGNVGTPPPNVGEIVDGYQYNGGDPASPSSWAKVN